MFQDHVCGNAQRPREHGRNYDDPRPRAEGHELSQRTNHLKPSNVSLIAPIAARPCRSLCLTVPRSFFTHERTKRFGHGAGVLEPPMDIRLEHNGVAAFHVTLVVLPAYTTREVIFRSHATHD